MRVLIIGGGGREHALGWKIAQSPELTRLFFAPGNPGTATLGENVTLNGNGEIAGFAKTKKIDLVVCGPENPLVDGLVDELEAVGVPCFGPVQACAQLEGSKTFAKEVMDATGVPTAAYRSFDNHPDALAYAQTLEYPQVLKADGLAAGKGVTICEDLPAMEAALQEAMLDAKFGEAGAKVVIEEFLTGTEASFHLISDGVRCIPLVTARDHKQLYDGNQGPNTGGMGTFAPNPIFTAQLAEQVQKEICEPIIRHMAERGTPFRGVLFTGLMIGDKGPKVLEYNTRFGDPETQVMMPLLDFDLLPVLMGAAKGKLPQGDFPFKDGYAACVVLASKGYPGSAPKGLAVTLPKELGEDQVVFHAGTKIDDSGQLLTNGGRVLGLTAWGDEAEATRARAYQLLETTQFEGKTFRTDIGGI